MTHPDPHPGPKRSTRLNGLVILLVVLLFVVAGAYVWSHWSAADDSAAEEARGPVQPAYTPPPDAGATSPEGAEAAQ